MSEQQPRSPSSVRIVIPGGQDLDEALARLGLRSFGTAFQPSANFQRLAGFLPTPEWPKIASQVGFGSGLVGAPGERVAKALASHEIAAATLGNVTSRFSLLPVMANLEGTLSGLRSRVVTAFDDGAWKSLMSIGQRFEGWEDTLREIGEQRRDLDEDTPLFVRRHGWPVPLCLPYRTYGRIVALHDRRKRDVSRAMIDYYRPGSKALRTCADVLLERPALDGRRPILRQALRAHRRGEHYLVIAALLPLVEGVLVDAVFTPENAPWKQRPQKALEQLRTEEQDDAVLRSVELLVISGAAGMGLLDDSHPSDAMKPTYKPRTLNRHAILHGYARGYGSEANALRMILLLTVVAEVVEHYARRA